jgi:hypothetical protein
MTVAAGLTIAGVAACAYQLVKLQLERDSHRIESASLKCEAPKVVLTIPVGLKREEYAAICKAQGGEPDKYYNERDDYDRAWATCYRPSVENGILVWTFRVEGMVEKRPRVEDYEKEE